MSANTSKIPAVEGGLEIQDPATGEYVPLDLELADVRLDFRSLDSEAAISFGEDVMAGLEGTSAAYTLGGLVGESSQVAAVYWLSATSRALELERAVCKIASIRSDVRIEVLPPPPWQSTDR